MNPWRVLLPLFLLAASALAQADTRALAVDLKSIRGSDKIPDATFRRIHDRMLLWIDARVRQSIPVPQMVQELKANGLWEPENLDSPDDSYPTSAGYVSVESIAAAPPGTLLIQFGIGVVCGEVPTLVFYQRKSLKRLGWASPPDFSINERLDLPWVFVSTEQRPGLFATIAVTRWCTSRFGSVSLHIVDLRNQSMKTLLRDYRSADRSREPDPSVDIENDAITFRYGVPSWDLNIFNRQGIARYSISSGAAVRIPPIAESIVGFVEEWMDMDAQDAKAWGTPDAAANLPAIREWRQAGGLKEFSGGVRCPGSPRTWYVVLQEDERQDSRTFVVSENGASQLKMLRAGSEPLPAGCEVIDIHNLAADLAP